MALYRAKEMQDERIIMLTCARTHTHSITVLLALSSHTSRMQSSFNLYALYTLRQECPTLLPEVFLDLKTIRESRGILTQMSSYTNCTVVHYFIIRFQLCFFLNPCFTVSVFPLFLYPSSLV